MNTQENRELDEIMDKLKAEVREGLSEKTMTLTDISIRMTKAFAEVKERFVREIEDEVNKVEYSDTACCEECGTALKKTKKEIK